MKIKVLGEKTLPALVLIHGGNSSSDEWNVYFKYFENKYCLYLVSITGHGEDFDSDYTSIHDNAKEICDYLKMNSIDSCYAFGRGLGAQIILSMIEQAPELFSKIILESVSCMYLGLYKYPLRLAAGLNYKVDDEDIKQKKKMPKYKFKKMVKDNVSFVLDIRINNFQNKALVLFAENDDKFFAKSAALLKNYINDSIVKQYPYGHLFGLTNVDDIINDILDFLTD